MILCDGKIIFKRSFNELDHINFLEFKFQTIKVESAHIQEAIYHVYDFLRLVLDAFESLYQFMTSFGIWMERSFDAALYNLGLTTDSGERIFEFVCSEGEKFFLLTEEPANDLNFFLLPC